MKITLKRPAERINRNLPYRIYLNGKKLTELKNGEEKELEVDSSGKLCAKISWCGSENISNLKEGDEIELSGRVFYNRVLPFLPAILPLLSVFVFMDEVGDFWKNVLLIFMALLLMILVVAISVFRTRWIRIECR
ncbi:hypothetical protein [Marinifilum flexuosum]|uniref:Uncharacterized protein n=1 Tax=Marinifilum flexuosum TaxID=1117708 RepID=A0A419X476_9BACT|nr:hypothetical protein [Marinifilum flexuosum]RKE02521.1 hypothetical protein BXY64_2611 [Marinifilum flexuosum]